MLATGGDPIAQQQLAEAEAGAGMSLAGAPAPELAFPDAAPVVPEQAFPMGVGPAANTGAPAPMQIPGLGQVTAPQGMPDATAPESSVYVPQEPGGEDPASGGGDERVRGSFAGGGGAGNAAGPSVGSVPRRGGRGGGLGRGIRDARNRKSDALGEYQAIQGARADSARDMGDEYRNNNEDRRDLETDRDDELQKALDPLRQAEEDAEQIRAQKSTLVERANAALNDTPRKAEISRKTKVIGALQIAFGAVAQVKTAFHAGVNIGNQGVQMMERAVQREIADHERVLDGKRDGVSTAQNELSIAREHYGDTVEARQRAEIAIREKYAGMFRSEAESLQSKEKAAAANDIADGIEAGAQQLEMQIAAEDEANLRRQVMAMAKARAKQQKAQQDQALNDRRLAATNISRTDPEIWEAVTPKLQQEILGQAGEINAAQSHINNIRKLRKEIGMARKLPAALQSEEMSRINGQLSSEVGQLQFLYKGDSMASLGVIAGADKEMMDTVTGDPDSIFEGNTLARIETLATGLTRTFNKKNAGNGIRIGRNNEIAGRRR